MKKRIFSCILVAVCLLLNVSTVFASEAHLDKHSTEYEVTITIPAEEISEDGFSIAIPTESATMYATSNVTMTLPSEGCYRNLIQTAFKASPTVSVTISGNPRCHYEVTLINSSSSLLHSYTFNGILGNGSTTNSHKFSFAPAAQYFVDVMPYDGSLAGETLTVTFHVS